MRSEQLTQNYISFAMEDFNESKELAHDDKRFWVNHSGKVKIQLDNKKNLWVSQEIWENIENFLPLPYAEIRDALKMWFLNNYKIEGTNPICDRLL